MAKFWPYLAPVWSEVVETGIKSFVFYWELIPYYEFWLKNRFLGLGMIQMAKYGVRGGRKWVQNDPDNFLLYPCVMKKCSKVHPLGWG